MLIFAPGSTTAIRGDLIVRSVLRSDLTPIPQTVEIELRDAPETRALTEGALIKVGRDGSEFLIVKNGSSGDTGRVGTDSSLKTRSLVGLLASCAPIAQRTPRSVVRYGATLGEIFRACGAQVRIESDFSVPVFACFARMTPSFEIAKALHEEAGALVLDNGRVSFRRLADMIRAEPVAVLREDSTESAVSGFVERHSVPWPFTTDATGQFLKSRAESTHGCVYRPRADARILNNLTVALITRRKAQSSFAPHILAGMRIDVAGTPLVVVTAAHVFGGGADGDGAQQYTRLWLAEVVR